MRALSAEAVLIDVTAGGSAAVAFALERIGPFAIVEHLVRRLRPLGLPVVVVADADGLSGDLEQRLCALGAEVEPPVAGDALSRAVDVATRRQADALVRVPPGSVFVDTAATGRLIDLFRRIRADYVIEGGLPGGTAVEMVTSEALARASTIATDAYDRAHVTSLIRRDRRFHVVRAVAPAALRRPGLCLEADSLEQVALLREAYEATSGSTTQPELTAIVRAADAILIRSMAASRRPHPSRATA
jgi:spore coat polysaccharide biosynthesis protein SpsF (cytidylyltransferase family)